ncbi:MAG: hypothetical protein BWY81_01181 [Firmicutes bacterium ADurb.Bin467]|nr:MAG: hypothetical protein BWY81_01181 [Firmicutes bacterium ADurb.Bin467]
MSSIEITNTGTEMPIVANAIAERSQSFARRIAAITPSGMPTTSDRITATSPTRIEIGNP